MTALDTNVIVRFLVRDDEEQALCVYKRFKQAEKKTGVSFHSAYGSAGDNLDLSDLLIAFAAKNSGCKMVLTFDKKASRHSFFQLLR